MTVGAVVAAVGSAVLVNLGIQGRIPSLVTFLAVCTISAAILGRPHRRRPGVITALGLAVGAASIMVVRASPWVVVPAAVVVTASLIMAAQDRLAARSGPLMTMVNYGRDVFCSIRWLLTPAMSVAGGAARQRRLLRGIGLAAAVVIPLAALLASADPVFGRVLGQGVGQGLWTHLATTVLLLPVTAGLILGSHRSRRPDPDPTTGMGPGTGTVTGTGIGTGIGTVTGTGTGPKPGSMVEGSIVLAAVALLLGSWCLTQVVVALGGAERLLETAGLTAAQHTRQGFFQLVAVVALLVLVMIGIDRHVERTNRIQRLWFLGLTSLIGLETVGLVHATYSRLSLYTGGFGHTMLRTAVAWFLAWLAIAMVVVIVAMNHSTSGHRFVGAGLFILAGLWVIAFGASNPEATVARGNLERSGSVALDPVYLTDQLGTDAVPVLVELLGSQPPEAQRRLREGLCRPTDRFDGNGSDGNDAGGLLAWNRSHSRARSALRDIGCTR